MMLKGKKITFGIAGSMCNIKQVIPQIQKLTNEGADIIPIMSLHYDNSEALRYPTTIFNCDDRSEFYCVNNKVLGGPNPQVLPVR